MADEVSPQSVLNAIAELNQWRGELSELTGSHADYVFTRTPLKNGKRLAKEKATDKLVADFQKTFAGDDATTLPKELIAIEPRYHAWAKERGIDTVSLELVEQFDRETGEVTSLVDKLTLSDRPKELGNQIASRCTELSRTALLLGCDDTTIAALGSYAQLMHDVLKGRATLNNNPSNWGEARLEANELLQSEAIAGIPLHRALDVALQTLELAAKRRADGVQGQPGAESQASPESQSRPHKEDYNTAALREMTGLENASLNKYAKQAGVATPGRGRRDHRYSKEDVQAILKVILSESSEKKVHQRCQTSLENLK